MAAEEYGADLLDISTPGVFDDAVALLLPKLVNGAFAEARATIVSWGGVMCPGCGGQMG